MDAYKAWQDANVPPAPPPMLGPPPAITPAPPVGMPMGMPLGMAPPMGMGMPMPMGAPMAPPAPPKAPRPMEPMAPVTPQAGQMFDAPLYDDYNDSLGRGQGMFSPPQQPGMNPGDPGLGGGELPGMGMMGMPPMMEPEPDPAGAEAIQREQAFAAHFPRALEAMNRTGLWKGGSDSAYRPDGLGNRPGPSARPDIAPPPPVQPPPMFPQQQQQQQNQQQQQRQQQQQQRPPHQGPQPMHNPGPPQRRPNPQQMQRPGFRR